MDVSEYLRPIANATVFDESVIRLIIPTRDSETRVECINPVLLIDEQYKEVEEKVKNLKKEVETALKTLNNDKR
jgi:ribosome recycling factor